MVGARQDRQGLAGSPDNEDNKYGQRREPEKQRKANRTGVMAGAVVSTVGMKEKPQDCRAE